MMNKNSYEQKYLKYKNKYLNAYKNKQVGGVKDASDIALENIDIDDIDLLVQRIINEPSIKKRSNLKKIMKKYTDINKDETNFLMKLIGNNSNYLEIIMQTHIELGLETPENILLEALQRNHMLYWRIVHYYKKYQNNIAFMRKGITNQVMLDMVMNKGSDEEKNLLAIETNPLALFYVMPSMYTRKYLLYAIHNGLQLSYINNLYNIYGDSIPYEHSIHKDLVEKIQEDRHERRRVH